MQPITLYTIIFIIMESMVVFQLYKDEIIKKKRKNKDEEFTSKGFPCE